MHKIITAWTFLAFSITLTGCNAPNPSAVITDLTTLEQDVSDAAKIACGIENIVPADLVSLLADYVPGVDTVNSLAAALCSAKVGVPSTLAAHTMAMTGQKSVTVKLHGHKHVVRYM